MSTIRVNEAKCQNMIRNILGLVEKPQKELASFAVRELLDLGQCDSILPETVKGLRSDLQERLGKEVVERVKINRPTDNDERDCASALIHYGQWTKDTLYTALSLKVLFVFPCTCFMLFRAKPGIISSSDQSRPWQRWGLL